LHKAMTEKVQGTFQKDRTVYGYKINSDNKIINVTSSFNEFATANDTESLSKDNAVGKDLFSYITGKETRHLYEVLMQNVRRSGKRATIPFRCDSPSLRRFMELHVIPERDGSLQFEGVLVREEERPVVPLLDPESDRSEEIISMCSWCKRIQIESHWHDVESALITHRFFEATQLPMISHGVCEDCVQLFEMDE